MELFKIFGTIAVNNQTANNGIDETTDKAEKAHPKIAEAFSKIGSAAVKAGTAIATGLAAGSAAIGALAKQSLESYAEYEQLVKRGHTIGRWQVQCLESRVICWSMARSSAAFSGCLGARLCSSPGSVSRL